MTAIRLSRSTLSTVPHGIGRPTYNAANVTAGIVHLGLGGFHRAHMARYTHELMNIREAASEWGIVGAGLLPADRAMLDALSPQDGLYTLVERSLATETATVVGSICRVIHSGDSSAALLEAIDRPEIRIVSLTVTEHGYCLNPATKVLDPSHPMIVADLADPARPHSAIGMITEAFRRRMISGRAPFTALSCDNIQHNGDVLRRAVLAFAQLRDPDLAVWIEAEGRFPNTMVDRITPVTQPSDIAYVAEHFGIRDNWPVVSEAFSQWIIEDDFVAGRPEWEAVGAQFVADVAPYETMKLRLLNGSHLAIAGLGRLAGYTYVDEALADGAIRQYMRDLMDRETGPTVPPVPGIDLERYKATLIERFSNAAIKDTVERVNTDAPLNYLLDPLRDRLRDGASIDLLALGVAAWLRRVRGVDEQGLRIDVRHPLAALLQARAEEGGADPRPLLAVTQLFGDLGQDARLVDAVGRWLTSLYEHGARKTLARAFPQAGV